MNSKSDKLLELKSEFLNKYKHEYIKSSFYDDEILAKQIYLITQMMKEVRTEHRELITDALINMQISLNIHDEVDQFFSDDDSHQSLENNQIKVLMGDYHSSLFYKLLSKYRKTEALYHFLGYIKIINEHKVDLLHRNRSKIEYLDKLELIYSGLFNGIASYFNVKDYHSNWLPLIQYELIYQNPELPWIKNLLENGDQDTYDYFQQRKELLQTKTIYQQY
ncbi:heptaprenyl diphosphate synthase component 1 [Alkalibacillus aidingensis]|uniref:heptaprenyl diphosphate synthase component 1 n=1 Tax=Alkalibacillus aidingensis TaxID=2747607 RepID=UPI001660311A|nr:heptaprenyl diphosphate synthase component 1 [Alkalibacillus aidingensis]